MVSRASPVGAQTCASQVRGSSWACQQLIVWWLLQSQIQGFVQISLGLHIRVALRALWSSFLWRSCCRLLSGRPLDWSDGSMIGVLVASTTFRLQALAQLSPVVFNGRLTPLLRFALVSIRCNVWLRFVHRLHRPRRFELGSARRLRLLRTGGWAFRWGFFWCERPSTS